jgi:hypothetical protein
VASGKGRRGIVERELSLTSESIFSENQRDILRPVSVSAQTRRYYPSAAQKTVSEREPGDAWFFRVLKMADDYEICADPDAMNQLLLTQGTATFVNSRFVPELSCARRRGAAARQDRGPQSRGH